MAQGQEQQEQQEAMGQRHCDHCHCNRSIDRSIVWMWAWGAGMDILFEEVLFETLVNAKTEM
jgi:hypothetical protein